MPLDAPTAGRHPGRAFSIHPSAWAEQGRVDASHEVLLKIYVHSASLDAIDGISPGLVSSAGTSQLASGVFISGTNSRPAAAPLETGP